MNIRDTPKTGEWAIKNVFWSLVAVTKREKCNLTVISGNINNSNIHKGSTVRSDWHSSLTPLMMAWLFHTCSLYEWLTLD